MLKIVVLTFGHIIDVQGFVIDYMYIRNMLERNVRSFEILFEKTLKCANDKGFRPVIHDLKGIYLPMILILIFNIIYKIVQVPINDHSCIHVKCSVGS